MGVPFQYMQIDIPKNQYIKGIEINDSNLNINFGDKKKVALVFICLNPHYWPYLGQVVKDCRQNFLPQHNVDYFAWTDYNEENKKKQITDIDAITKAWQEAELDKKQEVLNRLLAVFASTIRLYECFYPNEVSLVVKSLQEQGMVFKREGAKYWIEATRPMQESDITLFIEATKGILDFGQKEMNNALTGVELFDTEPVEWPAPTLLRYHLFLNQEEKLKEYDYIYYLDADMRVVAKISDEIINEGLLAAEHPMYSLKKQYVPPYEPNKASTAYIPRPGKVLDENGKPRFRPYYYAGGFQGGTAKAFIKAMKKMKKSIDKDFDNNYTAIWNDESHWNKYLSEYEGELAVMSPAYVYPDSLIKEYYEPLWGCAYEPKIITLTKPFSLSTQGAQEINDFIKK